jgi:hypothetical protein
MAKYELEVEGDADPLIIEDVTEEEFREKVHEILSDPKYSDATVKRVCEHCLEHMEEIDSVSHNWAYLLAELYEEACFSYLYEESGDRYLWTTDTISLAPPESLSDDTLIFTDKVLDEIESATESTRKEIFGQTEPPFEDYPRAVSWLREEAEQAKEELDGQNNQEEKREMKEQIMSLINEYRNSHGDVECEFTSYSIHYYEIPDFELTTIDDIPSGSRLDPLVQYLQEQSERTGFTEPALFIYFMYGLRPILPRWKLEKKNNDSNLPASFHLDIYAENITTRDFQRIHRKIKEMKNVSKIQPFKETDRILLSVVDSLGGVPEEGVDDFWEEVYEQCKAKGVDSWSSPYSAKMRWRRLQDKLE